MTYSTWTSRRWATFGVIAVSSIVAAVFYGGDDQGAAVNTAEADTTAPRTATPSTTQNTSRKYQNYTVLKNSWHPQDNQIRPADRPQDIANKKCERWLQRDYAGKYTKQYDPRASYEYKVDLQGGEIQRHSAYFGGSPFIFFHAQAAEYINGDLARYIKIPEHVCVLSNDYEVVGMEFDPKDGLR